VQAGFAAAIALPPFWLSPWPHLIGFPSLGTLVALFGRFAPAQSRKRIVLLAGVWQVLAVLVMSGAVWLGASEVLQLVLLAVSCGVFLFISIVRVGSAHRDR